MQPVFPLALFGGSLGAGEVGLILIMALLLFGSKRLPGIARQLGKALEEFRRAARQVSDEILHGSDEQGSGTKTDNSRDTKNLPGDKAG